MFLRLNFTPFDIISSPNLCLIPLQVLPSRITNNLSMALFFSSIRSLEYFDLRTSSSFFDAARRSLSFLGRENNLVSITTPLIDGGAFIEASFTSPALSPKMARRSFSSGVGSLSPFGVILPTRMSPSFTSAPTRMIPSLSRFFTASSLTFGISEVNSSSPRLVSRTSSSYSSMWMEVKISSETTFSEITMASSKL